MEKNPYLDPAAQAFLEEFRFGLSSVRDVSAELDHRVKALKAIGGFSSVYATDWAPPGAETIRVCYKELRPLSSSMPEQINQTRKLMKHLTHEVKIWKELRHPNILEFIGYAIAGERSDMKAILVSKWCTNGNVMQYLRAHPNSNRTDLVVGMANGLHHLHSRKPQIIHGDLKPDNVLISDEGAAQLCDFGMSRVMNELSRVAQTTSTPLGYTIRYSSYEVIVEEKKTEFSDVYAFGCTSIQVLFDQHPFPDIRNDHRVIAAIENRQSPWVWDMDVPIQRILSRCCDPHQNERPPISISLYGLTLHSLDRLLGIAVDSHLHPGVLVEGRVLRHENRPDQHPSFEALSSPGMPRSAMVPFPGPGVFPSSGVPSTLTRVPRFEVFPGSEVLGSVPEGDTSSPGPPDSDDASTRTGWLSKIIKKSSNFFRLVQRGLKKSIKSKAPVPNRSLGGENTPSTVLVVNSAPLETSSLDEPSKAVSPFVSRYGKFWPREPVPSSREYHGSLAHSAPQSHQPSPQAIPIPK